MYESTVGKDIKTSFTRKGILMGLFSIDGSIDVLYCCLTLM